MSAVQKNLLLSCFFFFFFFLNYAVFKGFCKCELPQAVFIDLKKGKKEKKSYESKVFLLSMKN